MADIAHGLHKNKDWIKTFNSAFSGKQMLFSRWWPRTAVMNYRLPCKGLLSCQAHNVVDQRQVKHDETCMYRMKVRVEAWQDVFWYPKFYKRSKRIAPVQSIRILLIACDTPPMGPGPPEEMSLSIKAELTVEKMSEVQPAEVFHESGGI